MHGDWYVKYTIAKTLGEAMAKLNLTDASMKMSSDVQFVLAIPILEPEADFVKPNPTAGVLYIDSKDADFWMTDCEVAGLVDVVREAVRALEGSSGVTFDRIRNTNLREVAQEEQARGDLPNSVANALETMDKCDPPRTLRHFAFNFDHSDLTPIVASARSLG